jgi:hypothetical protein
VFYPQGEDLQYSLDRRLGGPESLSGHRGERKESFASARDRTLVIQSVGRQYTNSNPIFMYDVVFFLFKLEAFRV